ncbi:MAG: hypothetical protein RBR77_04240 [Thauera sp.]|nr:hypothetical protein [Thauera sp.]
MQLRPLVAAGIEQDREALSAALAALSAADRIALPPQVRDLVEAVGTLPRFDALVARLMQEDSASWWIDSRGSAFPLLFDRFRSDILAAEADAACPDLAAAVAEEALLRPAEARSTFIAEVRLAGSRIEVRLPVRDDVFANAMRQQGLNWGGTCWRRLLTEPDGQPAHRLAEIAHAILAAGFPVRVQDATARALAVSGDFTPGHRRWVSVVRAGKFSGWCRITWRRPDDLYQAARSLPGSRYADGAVVVPADAVDAVLDFAATYGFGVSRDVQDLAAAHHAALESGAVVEHVRKHSSEPVRSHGMPKLQPDAAAGIDEGLLDD